MSPEVKEALPGLMDALLLDDGRVGLSNTAAKGVARFGQAAVPEVAAALPRTSAARALELMGPAAKGAVAPLLNVVEDEKVFFEKRVAAAKALGRIGPGASQAVPGLTRVLHTQDPRPLAGDNGWLRFETAAAVARIDPANAYALDTLKKCLTDMNPVVCVSAAYELARHAPDDKEAVRRLINLYGAANTPNGVVIERLGELGPPAKDAYPKLLEVYQNAQRFGQRHEEVAIALVRIDPEAAVPLMVQALEGENWMNRLTAARALAEAGPQGRTAVRALRKLADAGTAGDLHYAAVEALKKLESQK
jgi:HEAT repeat protein